MARFGGGGGGGNYSTNDQRADRSLIEDSCDQKMRKEFNAADDGAGILLSTSR